MTTILIYLRSKDGNEIIEPLMDHFFDQKDLDFIKRGTIREFLKMISDINGGFIVTFKEWLEDVGQFQETPRMAANKIELNAESVKVAFEKFK